VTARKAFLLRIDPRLWTSLEKWAADELRSVNGQIEYILGKAVRDAGRQVRTGSAPPPGAKRERPDPDGGPADSGG
jgi:hypothetical protein